MYLLDTNVVSELRRPRPHGGVLAWVRAAPVSQLHICAVTIGELQAGVERTRASDPNKAEALETWIDSVPGQFSVFPMDAACFRVWAKLLQGKPTHLYGDAMIAACAVVYGFKVVTRNTRDFARFDVEVINPFVQPVPSGIRS